MFKALGPDKIDLLFDLFDYLICYRYNKPIIKDNHTVIFIKISPTQELKVCISKIIYRTPNEMRYSQKNFT